MIFIKPGQIAIYFYLNHLNGYTSIIIKNLSALTLSCKICGKKTFTKHHVVRLTAVARIKHGGILFQAVRPHVSKILPVMNELNRICKICIMHLNSVHKRNFTGLQGYSSTFLEVR